MPRKETFVINLQEYIWIGSRLRPAGFYLIAKLIYKVLLVSRYRAAIWIAAALNILLVRNYERCSLMGYPLTLLSHQNCHKGEQLCGKLLLI